MFRVSREFTHLNLQSIKPECFELNSLFLKQKCTFLFGNEVLHDDISHAVSVCIAILVEAVNCTEDKLVAGNGSILAAKHLDKR